MHLAAIRASQLDVLSLTPLSKETDSEIRDDGSWNENGERESNKVTGICSRVIFSLHHYQYCDNTVSQYPSTVVTPWHNTPCHNTPVQPYQHRTETRHNTSGLYPRLVGLLLQTLTGRRDSRHRRHSENKTVTSFRVSSARKNALSVPVLHIIWCIATQRQKELRSDSCRLC